MRVFVIAEIGINHNGSIETCKQLIDLAHECGCDAVKLQKRSIEKVYDKNFLKEPRKSPWGDTQRHQKEGLEFNLEQYQEIDCYCKTKGIDWFASAWDTESQNFLRQFDCKYNKIASPMVVHKKLLHQVAEEKKYTFISTGMSTIEDISQAVEIFQQYNCPFELLHCVSDYPLDVNNANLNCIYTLKEIFGCKVGYSGHETGTAISLAAVSIGASSLERHITLDRSLYGSDQSASLERSGLRYLVGGVRKIELAMGSREKIVSETELQNSKKLRAKLE